MGKSSGTANVCVLCACGGSSLLTQGGLHSFKSTKHFNTNNLTNLKNFLLLNPGSSPSSSSSPLTDLNSKYIDLNLNQHVKKWHYISFMLWNKGMRRTKAMWCSKSASKAYHNSYSTSLTKSGGKWRVSKPRTCLISTRIRSMFIWIVFFGRLVLFSISRPIYRWTSTS